MPTAQKRPSPDPGNEDLLFRRVVEAFAGDQDVTPTRMFGSDGLKVRGKVFAMLHRGKLVLKLPRERVDALVSAGRGDHFDPGHGRVMKEWVAVRASRQWPKLAADARDFVAGQR